MIRKKAVFIIFIIQTIIFFNCNLSIKNDVTNEVTIRGNIEHFKDYSNDFISVKILVQSILDNEHIDYSSFVDTCGNFEIKFPMLNSQNITLIYSNQYYLIFANPADNIIVNLDAKKISDGESEDKTITFNGDGKKINMNIVKYYAYKNQNIPHEFRFGTRLKAQTSSPDEYKKFLFSRREFEQNYLKKFSSNHDVDDTFIEWLNYQIDFDCLTNLIKYSEYQNRIRRKEGKPENYDAPESYYDFYKDFNLGSNTASMSTNFSSFINNYFQYLWKKFGNSQVRDNNLKPEEINMKLYNFFKDNSHDFGREVLLTRYLDTHFKFSELHTFEKCYQEYINDVQTEYLKEYIITKYNTAIGTEKLAANKNGSLSELKDIIEGDSLLTKIIDKHKNKVIYLDFWSTGCGPCLASMPVSMKLHDYYKDKNLSMIYLCIESTEKNWKSIIKKRNLTGEHYFLSNKQYELVSPFFGITATPHHVLIDKKGRIIEKKAKRPSTNDYKEINLELVKLIDLLLKEN